MKKIMKVSKFYEIFMQNTVLYQVFYIIKKNEFKSFFYSFELIKKVLKSKKYDPLILSEFMEQYDLDKEEFSYKDKILIETILKEINDMINKKDNSLFEHDKFSKSQFMKAHFINFNYENFLEFENRNFFLFYSTEFENYLFRCFKSILEKKPVLLGDIKITLNELLSKKNLIRKIGLSEKKPISENIIDLLIEEKAEKRIHDKFYEDYNEIFEFASKKLGIKHEITSEHLIILNLIKQIRNVYVHGDGKLNHIHMNKINKYYKKFTQENLGDKILIDSEFVEYINGIYITVALLFDDALTKAYPKLLTDIDVSMK